MVKWRRFAAMAVLLPGLAWTQQADNTKMNDKDNPASADKAKNNKSDVKLMAQIRRAIVKDRSLSMDAHNVKVVAKGGKVTLQGPVKSEDEKKSIVAKATQVAGEGNVTDELTVK